MKGNKQNDKKPKLSIEKLYVEVADNPMIRGTIQLIPQIGGALDVLLFSKAQKIKEARLKELLDTLSISLKKVEENKIDQAYIQSDEFLFIVEQVFIKYVSESNKRKREYYAQILVNSSIRTFSGFNKELLLSLMSNLSEFHLSLLNNITECMASNGVISIRSLKKLGYGEDIKNHLMYLSSTGVIDRYTEVTVDSEYDDVSADTNDYFKISHLGNELISFVFKL